MDVRQVVELVDVQTLDLKVFDLEVPDDGASDRQPGYRKGADGALPTAAAPDGGSAKASRWELYRCTLLPAAATP